MTTPSVDAPVDGQWLDYYALLDVPVGADEDTIRKRIGKVYAEAAANSDHRNLARRQYFQALVERVLPQCRRVLLDGEWRAKYDRQHQLHQIGDQSAQDYVSFIAGMRGDGAPLSDEAALSQRAQEEIQAARRVVETAISGAELELLPSQSVSTLPALRSAPAVAVPVAAVVPVAAEKPPVKAPTRSRASRPAPVSEPYLENVVTHNPSSRTEITVATAPIAATPAIAVPAAEVALSPAPQLEILTPEIAASKPLVETRQQPGELARAQVITAQEAADIRRQRASNPDQEIFVGPGSRNAKTPASRVSIAVDDPALKRRISPTSLNLMVAITGVLLTIVIQRFAATPAIATSAGRTPIFIAVAPEFEDAIENASLAWEKTPGGAPFDVVVQAVDGTAGLQRALGKSGEMPDAWIPSNALYAQQYNQLAPAAKRPTIETGASIAQTPMVLVARADHAGGLLRRFPDHKIGNWTALREAVASEAPGRLGLSDPRTSVPGAVARFSMAREWGQEHDQSPEASAKNLQFWKWMAEFEENVPSSAPAPGAMVKDLVLGTTGRYWWAVAYESDALSWLGQGKPLELFYLPRTALADHPFCALERVGAPLEVAAARAAFARFLQSAPTQKSLLQSGFRPTEISPSTNIEKNPFTQSAARNGGARLQGLPRDERLNFDALSTIQSQWSKRYG